MNLLMLAPPGAGKGTQAARLAKIFDIEHIASGELLRHEVERNTRTGRLVRELLAKGDLVPDRIVVPILRQRVIAAAGAGGYVLDGYPRNLRQAEAAFELATKQPELQFDAVLNLVVSREELRRRLSSRAVAEGRSDDAGSTVEHRLEVFDRQTQPLLEYYESRRILRAIDGEQPVDAVTADIVRQLEGAASGSG